MSEQLEWIEESESTYVAQSGKRRYVISKQPDGQWAVGLSDGGALFSAKFNKPRLAATLEEAEQIAHGLLNFAEKRAPPSDSPTAHCPSGCLEMT